MLCPPASQTLALKSNPGFPLKSTSLWFTSGDTGNITTYAETEPTAHIQTFYTHSPFHRTCMCVIGRSHRAVTIYLTNFAKRRRKIDKNYILPMTFVGFHVCRWCSASHVLMRELENIRCQCMCIFSISSLYFASLDDWWSQFNCYFRWQKLTIIQSGVGNVIHWTHILFLLTQTIRFAIFFLIIF